MVETKHGTASLLVRTAGIAALVAALLNAVSYFVFEWSFWYPNPDEIRWIPTVAERRLRIGIYLGVAITPFVIAGFWHTYQGLKRIGRWTALPPVLIGSYAVAVECALHAVQACMVLGQHKQLSGVPDYESSELLRLLIDRMFELDQVLWMVVSLGFAVFSVWFMVLVLVGKTRYPRWFGLLNPLLLMFVIRGSLSPLAPEHSGEWLFFGSNALSFAVFFAISTALLWRSDA